MFKLFAQEGQFLYPQQLLKKAFDTYYPEVDMDLYCEPEYMEGQPHWAFDNFRCNGAVTDKASFLFYTQPSWGKHFTEKYGDRCKCVTYACDPELHKPTLVDKEYDIGFIGNIVKDTDRDFQLKMVDEKYHAYISTDTPSQEMSQAYSKCKIIFNPQRYEEINIRFFEGLALGVQIVKYSPALHLFAQEGIHYLSYKNEDELVQKINYLLENPLKREEMAKKAREHALAFHTYKHRAEEMLRAIGVL